MTIFSHEFNLILCSRMGSLTCDQLKTATIVLGIMLFVMLLLLLCTVVKLMKYGEFDNLFDKFFRPCRLLVTKTAPRVKQISVEDEILTQQIPCSKILKRGKRGQLKWKFSEEYLDQLNKAWDERHDDEIRKKPCVVNVDEACHEESPENTCNLSAMQQKHGVKWSELVDVFWFERNELLNKGQLPILGHYRSPNQLPKPILKKQKNKAPKLTQSAPYSRGKEPTQGQEEQCKPNHGFKYITKTLLSFLEDTPTQSDGLNEVEQGQEPSSSGPRQYKYLTKTLLSFLDELPEDAV